MKLPRHRRVNRTYDRQCIMDLQHISTLVLVHLVEFDQAKKRKKI